MTDGLPDDGDAGDDLPPLTLREKVRNKAYNRQLDRRLNFYTALVLGFIGVGTVRELFEFINGNDEFNALVLLGSLAIGIGAFEIVAYVSKKLTRRED